MGWIKRTWVDRTVVNQDRLVNEGKENEKQKILCFRLWDEVNYDRRVKIRII